MMVNKVPSVILVAKKSINPGEEPLWDYGDCTKEGTKITDSDRVRIRL